MLPRQTKRTRMVLDFAMPHLRCKGQRERDMSNIVILTGAGISAESGLGTFRDEGGLGRSTGIEDVATPEGFARDPQLVVDFYNARRAQAADATPNAAHEALARLAQFHTGNVTLVTQNVDDLHEKSGSADVIHMHGALNSALCSQCETRWPAPFQMAVGMPARNVRPRPPDPISSGSGKSPTTWSGSSVRCWTRIFSWPSGRRAMSIPPQVSFRWRL